MRSILNVSLPEGEKKKIEKRAKKAGKTVSAYILNVVRITDDMISEDELFEIMEEADKDYREGRTKELKNPEDLLK